MCVHALGVAAMRGCGHARGRLRRERESVATISPQPPLISILLLLLKTIELEGMDVLEWRVKGTVVVVGVVIGVGVVVGERWLGRM